MAVFCLDKSLGQTPLEALEQFRTKHSDLQGVKLAYAGRLDPMATGLLLILSGATCQERDKFQNLEKHYLFTVLLGFSTDSYDLLGKLTYFTAKNIPNNIEQLVRSAITDFPSEWSMPYPPYSAKTIAGIPLYRYAREEKLAQIVIPTKAVQIKNLQLINITEIKSKNLLIEIKNRLALVHGDFRQKEIKDIWQEQLNQFDKNQSFILLNLEVTCSSGTYVRSLVQELGKMIQIPAVTFAIRRTCVGEYCLNNDKSQDNS
ncbi:MAG: hypothetical protein WCJ58_00595 [bacterium]